MATGRNVRIQNTNDIMTSQGKGLSKNKIIGSIGIERPPITPDKILNGSFTLCSSRINFQFTKGIISLSER